MAGEDLVVGVAEDVGAGLVDALSALPGMAGLIKIGQVAGIVVIVYVSFLILKSILGIKHTRKLARLDVNVQEINKKFDKLIELQTKPSKQSKKKSKK